MITRHELKELATYMNEDAFFVSLYLNVDPKDNPKDSWLLHYKNLARDTISKTNAQDRPIIEKELKRIEKFLSDRPDGLKRGLVIISCPEKNFWRVHNTAMPFINQLVIEHDPFIKPLASMLDLFQRYLVVVVGKTKARILITRMGEIEEVTKVLHNTDSLDFDPNRSGSLTDSASHSEKMDEKVFRIVHKDALKDIEKVMAEEEMKRIILAGTDRGRAQFKDVLPNQIKERVVAELSVDRNGSDHEILEKLIPIMKDVEYQFERKALDELFDQEKKIVLGLSDVLTALQQGNVHKMYVLTHVKESGMVCNQCGALTPVRDSKCPYCNNEMHSVEFMLDLAIQKAMDLGARVDMLEHAPRLEKAGGIGALLRY